jgi:2-polyprenyl-3-methyl-5-hydroxy-6-metoxy-1,4-benzoquinol methylase
MLGIKKLLASSDQENSLGKGFREKRFRFFEEKVKSCFPDKKKITILDVGGTQKYWEDKKLVKEMNLHITILNLEKIPVSGTHFSSVAGDATNLSEYGDNSFDLVFSNSVIEHLYTWENQQKMAREIRRVGKNYFVQTPNKYFVIEPHYALPIFQFLPKKLGYLILTKTKLSRFNKWDPKAAQQYLDEIRLLSLKEMRNLFPDGQVYHEKVMGMNKSFTLYRF